ncbi:hypothetical protein GCM10009603_32200 [Nocardiopsis exhalans]
MSIHRSESRNTPNSDRPHFTRILWVTHRTHGAAPPPEKAGTPREQNTPQPAQPVEDTEPIQGSGGRDLYRRSTRRRTLRVRAFR